MIRVHELQKSFGKLIAVNHVSFEISAGETFGLLGPNGAGKTTTMNMLSGLATPDSGSIELDGKLLPSQPAARRLMGIAPQSLSLYDNLSARENLQFFARLYDLHGSQLTERVDWSLEFPA